MVAQRATPAAAWAYAKDIRGTRCGPEDGPWPRQYEILDEKDIWRELRALAKPQSVHFDNEKGYRADGINFQPSPKTRTQDRYVVKQLEFYGEKWTLTGVFDGHLGDVTVEHVSYHLPIIIQEFLQEAYDKDRTRLSDPSFISGLLSRSIVAFDNAIAGDVLDLFGGIDNLRNYSDAEIRSIINDGGDNFRKARLNMYGTTALVALVDPAHGNLWVANLGDCQAVLVTPLAGDRWDISVLTTEHNGHNEAEIERVRRQHPGEPECVLERRVLGALAPFRCLGDTPFKQPPEFTRRILYNLMPGFQDVSPWEDFLRRNKTPPYISAEPEITHRVLTPFSSSPRYLVLSSDGFSDLCDEEGKEKIFTDWANIISRQSPPSTPITPLSPSHPQAGNPPHNMALRLLHRALGGDDRNSVSRVLTLDMDVAWIDDTCIVVQTL